MIFIALSFNAALLLHRGSPSSTMMRSSIGIMLAFVSSFEASADISCSSPAALCSSSTWRLPHHHPPAPARCYRSSHASSSPGASSCILLGFDVAFPGNFKQLSWRHSSKTLWMHPGPSVQTEGSDTNVTGSQSLDRERLVINRQRTVIGVDHFP